MKPKNTAGNDARQRIFEASVSLIARRGFDAVGIREIAKAAGVNIARINYYFGNKTGLLKAIIEEFSKRYYEALCLAAPASQEMWDAVNANISAIVGVYRKDIELAVAAEKVLWMDIPEVHAAQIHQHTAHRADMNRWFIEMGLDPQDPALMAIARGLITNTVGAHFTSRYHYDTIISAKTRKVLAGKKLPEHRAKYTDAFYRKYCARLTDLYIAGITALGTPSKKTVKRTTRRAAPKKKAARK